MAPASLLSACHMACWVIVCHEVHTSAGSTKVHIEEHVTPKMTNGFTSMHKTTDAKPGMFSFLIHWILFSIMIHILKWTL